MNRTSLSDSTLTDSSSGFAARTLGLPYRNARGAFMARRTQPVVEEILQLMDARNRKNEQVVMDRILNNKLERDKLPENTPLPIYLAHREPRSPSPPSRWDKKRSKTVSQISQAARSISRISS
ncbi:uncharacterized protein Dere_GG15338, partial [Drosophila erecta]